MRDLCMSAGLDSIPICSLTVNCGWSMLPVVATGLNICLLYCYTHFLVNNTFFFTVKFKTSCDILFWRSEVFDGPKYENWHPVRYWSSLFSGVYFRTSTLVVIVQKQVLTIFPKWKWTKVTETPWNSNKNNNQMLLFFYVVLIIHFNVTACGS